MSGIGRNQIISDIPNTLLLGSPSESSYDITPVAYIAANSPGIFAEKNVLFLLFSILRPLYYSLLEVRIMSVAKVI